MKWRIVICVIILLITLIWVSGCNSICQITENNQITVSRENIAKVLEYMGTSYHYNITLNISNKGDKIAKFLTLDTNYCNDHPVGNMARYCEKRTINLDYLNPKETVTRYFEYNRLAGVDGTDGDWQLEYNATSCQ
jgi:uncharacterized protein YceK